MDTVKIARVNYNGVDQLFDSSKYKMTWLNPATDGRRDLAVVDTKGASKFIVKQSSIYHLEIAKDPETATSPVLFFADFTMYDPGAVTAAELLARYGLTFTRASAAHVQTGASSISAIGSGAARIGQPSSSSTYRGLVMEEARTNLVLAEDMTGTGWTAVAVDGYAQGGYFTDPLSEAKGNLVEIQGATSDSYGPTRAINAADHAVAVSFFVKDVSGGSAGFAYGVEQLAGTATVKEIAAGSVPTTWTRKWFAATGIKFRSAISNSYSKAVYLSKVGLAHMMVEDLHSWAGEWVDTATARAIDKLSLPVASVIDSGMVLMDVEFIPKWTVPESTNKYYLWYISANYNAYFVTDTGQYKLVVTVNGTARTSTIKIDANTINDDCTSTPIRLFVQAGAGLKVRAWMSIGGAAPVLIMNEAAVSSSITGTTVYLFNDNSASSLNAWVKNVSFLKANHMPYWLVGTEGV